MARPCSSAVPSRAGPAARSAPWAVALPSSSFWLVSYWSQLMYGVGVADQGDPLLARHELVALLAARGEAFAAAAVGECAGVAGVVQGAQHPPVLQRHPGQLALVRAGGYPYCEQQSVSRRSQR